MRNNIIMSYSLINTFENVLTELRDNVSTIDPYTCTVCPSRKHEESKCLYDVLHDITPFPTVIIEMICDIKKDSDTNDVYIKRQRNLMSQCLKYLPVMYIDKEINSNMDNIMSGNISKDFLIDRFYKLINCDCCNRHQFRKPIDIIDDSYTYYVSNVERERKCNCTCRHNSRVLSECFLEHYD